MKTKKKIPQKKNKKQKRKPLDIYITILRNMIGYTICMYVCVQLFVPQH